MSVQVSGLVRRSPVHIAADKSRVVTQLFVPGQEGFDEQGSRSAAVLQRVLVLQEDEVQRSYDDVVARFEGRHHGLTETFLRHADELSDRLDPDLHLSPTRRLLLGATFTSEYAIEGAALCNPSMVLHPDQTGVSPSSTRFVMSARAIGEGHRSSIGFRTGTITGSGDVNFDPAPTFATAGRRDTALLDAEVFKGELSRLHGSEDDADYVLGHLGRRFTEAELDGRLSLLEVHVATRTQARRTIGLIRGIAARSYSVRFESGTPLAERVLLPETRAESHGTEDARFVRFAEDDASVTYYATYTAYNGTDIRQQLPRPRTSCTSPRNRSSGRRRPTRASPSSLAGSVAVSPPSRDPTERRTPSPFRTIPVGGKNGWHVRSRRDHGKSCNSATAGHPSRPRRDGWCSPTASGQCARTTSGPCCSTSKTPRESLANFTSHCSARLTMSRTAMCRMSSTRAAPFSMREPSFFPMESVTLRSALQRCRSTNFLTRW